MEDLLRFERFLEIDFARFDMSIAVDILTCFEHYIFGSFYDEEQHPLFHEALKIALFTSATNWFNLTYQIEGTRCSGDAWTSIGNGLLNHFVIWTCLRKLPTDSWVSFHEGDDGVIGIDSRELNQALYNLSFLDCLGLRAKIDVYNDINEASFCGRFLAEVRGHLISYCDPLRSLTKFHTTVSLGDSKYLLAAKANSYYHNDGHTPVVGALTCGLLLYLLPLLHPDKMQRYLRNVKKDLPWHYQQLNVKELIKVNKVVFRVNPLLRSAFYLRTGITPREQVRWEEYYKTFATHGIPEQIDKMRVEWTPVPWGKWMPWRTSDWIR